MESIVAEYIRNVEVCEKETQRKEHFILFLAQLFPSHAKHLRALASGAETFVKLEKTPEGEKQRGFIDSFYGNLVIEFEHGIPEMLETAEGQLQEYVAKLWSQEGENSPYLCIASDGVRWSCYAPSLAEDVSSYPLKTSNILLSEVEKADFSSMDADEVKNWLDRVFFRENQLQPDPQAICLDFGSNSHTFLTSKPILLNFYRRARGIPRVAMAIDSWEKYLKYSYGTIDGTEDLFVRHTYLSVVTKLLSSLVLSGEKKYSLSSTDIASIVDGNFFTKFNIRNYAEKDFFHWIDNIEFKTDLEKLWFAIFNSLKTYDFTIIKNDFLKDIYQDLVDPDDRHDLGEYYTPDWLCEYISKDALGKYNNAPKMADITCGSGSFLRAFIKKLQATLEGAELSKSEILKLITNSVYGFEIHPLAVFIAKTNYLLALGDLRQHAESVITLPVYLCDSLLTYDLDDSDLFSYGDVNITPIGEQTKLVIPEDMPESTFDLLIDFIGDLALIDSLSEKLGVVEPKVNKFLAKLDVPHEKTQSLTDSVIKLAVELSKKEDLIDLDIWKYTIKNTYRPLVFKNKFDLILGNPPWLSFRYVGSPAYKNELEHLGIEKYNIAPQRSSLRTQMELGTVFLAHASEYYLRNQGSLYFVLPRSVFSADHHELLRKRTFKGNYDVTEIWDLDSVSPLFRVPSCVVVCRHTIERKESGEGFCGKNFAAKLPYQNVNYEVAKQSLEVKDTYFHLARMNERTALSELPINIQSSENYYKSRFRQGADLMPRSFYFVELDADQKKITFAKTSENSIKSAKKPYKDVNLSGLINSELIYKTALAENVLPFCISNPPSIHLPVLKEDSTWKILSPDELVLEGFSESSAWFTKVDQTYVELKGVEEGKVFEMLNYNNKLLTQNPNAKYWVLYCSSGTNLCAAVYENTEYFWADQKTYWFATDTKMEAYYLAAVLNASTLDDIIKPFQSRGLIGERDIHKKVLDIGIPKYENSDEFNELANEALTLEGEIQDRMEEFSRFKSLGKKRTSIRAAFESKFKAIDQKATELFLND